MQDFYPTRINDYETFVPRLSPVLWGEGLRDQDLESYEANGYLVKRRFFDDALIAAVLRESAERYTVTTPGQFRSQEPDSPVTRSILSIHEDGEAARISKHAGLMSLVTPILGGASYVHQSRINYKAGLGANGWHWHSDFETWHAQDGMPMMRALSAMIPLTQNTAANGALMVIPGSHQYFWGCKKSTHHSAEENFSDQKDGVPSAQVLARIMRLCRSEIQVLECAPGDLVLFDSNTLHGSAENMTPYQRANLFIVYNSVKNKLVAPFSCEAPRPLQMAAR